MNNPGLSDSGGSVYDRLCGVFYKLLRNAQLTVEYPDLAKLPGFEVVIADGRFDVLSYWKDGTEERLQIYPGQSRDSAALAYSNPGSAQVISRVPSAEQTMWVALSNGAIKAADRPAPFPSEDPHSVIPDKFQKDNADRQASGLWALTRGSATYRVGEFQEKQGLWKFQVGKKPKLIAGDVFSPIISSDGNWAVLTKSTNSPAHTVVAVRVNLRSGSILPVEIPEADSIQAISYVPEQQRFLIVRTKGPDTGSHQTVGPDKPEYWLVEAQTGHANVTNEEIRPFTHIGPRPLQSTSEPGTYWAAIPNATLNGTDFGRFDARSFRFTAVLRVPSLQFNSQAIWVDSAAKSIYITYRSHLLRVPLQ